MMFSFCSANQAGHLVEQSVRLPWLCSGVNADDAGAGPGLPASGLEASIGHRVLISFGSEFGSTGEGASSVSAPEVVVHLPLSSVLASSADRARISS